MSIFYNAADWYWQLPGDDGEVWSSNRFMYVDTLDADYQLWLTVVSNQPTPIADTDQLNQVMVAQVIQPRLTSTGLTVQFTNNSSLNATYGLDPLTLDQIGTVARDSACGIGLPLGLPVFVYPNLNTDFVVFSATEIIQLYKAMRDYITAFNQAVYQLTHQVVPAASLPSQPVII